MKVHSMHRLADQTRGVLCSFCLWFTQSKAAGACLDWLVRYLQITRLTVPHANCRSFSVQPATLKSFLVVYRSHLEVEIDDPALGRKFAASTTEDGPGRLRSIPSIVHGAPTNEEARHSMAARTVMRHNLTYHTTALLSSHCRNLK